MLRVPGNRIESLMVNVDHGDGIDVRLMVSTCLAWDGKPNLPGPEILTEQEAIRIAAYLMCGDWHLAQDLTQTTLAKLYAAWGRKVVVESVPDTPLHDDPALRLTLLAALGHLMPRDRDRGAALLGGPEHRGGRRCRRREHRRGEDAEHAVAGQARRTARPGPVHVARPTSSARCASVSWMSTAAHIAVTWAADRGPMSNAETVGSVSTQARASVVSGTP